jgi:hypothetical protein
MIFTDSYIWACHLGKMDFLCHLGMPVHDSAMGDREGGEGATATGGGGRGEAAGTQLLVGLRRRRTTMVRITMESGGTKQRDGDGGRRRR